MFALNAYFFWNFDVFKFGPIILTHPVQDAVKVDKIHRENVERSAYLKSLTSLLLYQILLKVLAVHLPTIILYTQETTFHYI